MLRYPLWLLLCLPLAALAEVNESISYRYYEADGTPGPASLRDRLNAVSPIRHKGEVYHGYTDWDLGWHFWWKEADGQCRVSGVKVDLDAVIQLPELVSEDDQLQQQFNTYVEALQRHEIGHYIIGIQAANEIHLRLSKLDPMASCSILEKEANRIAQEILDEHIEKEKAFDELTRYGAGQGVVLDDKPAGINGTE